MSSHLFFLNMHWKWGETGTMRRGIFAFLWESRGRTKHLHCSVFASTGIHTMLLFILLSLLCSGMVCSAEQVELQYNVGEGKEVEYRVGDIAADTETTGPYFFVSLQSSSATEWFEFEISGEIRIKKPLDRETMSEFSVLAQPLVDNGISIRISISVTDENDNRPEFPSELVELEISENVPVGTRRTLDSASDPDLAENSVAGYNITGGNIGEYFRVEAIQAFGIEDLLQLDLIVNKKLNREVISHYELVIQAYDGGTPPLTGSMNLSIEILDINESPPEFVQEDWRVNLSESFSVGARVVQVEATDSDSGANGVVIYEILEFTDPTETFIINSATGEIFLNKQLNFEETGEYTLVIAARDNATSPLESTALVRVIVQNENEHPPSINVIFTSGDGSPKISEDATPGDFVARISVSDPDDESEDIGVSIVGGQDHFRLQTKDDVIYLICVAEPLDREAIASYDIVIRAMDAGTPPQVAEESFTLIVTDVNDNPPVFLNSPYTKSKSEASLNGSLIMTVLASDRDAGRNAEVRYAIVNTAEPFVDWFAIDPQSGMITIASPLDREKSSEVVLTVMASDLGEPSLNSTTTVTVTITDVNDNYPVFVTVSYNSSIDEDVEEGTCFLQVQATDADADEAGHVTYSIDAVQGTLSHFSVDSNSGSICTSQELDRDSGVTSFDFQIRATDGGGLSSVVPVKVLLRDVNDNVPEFYPESYAVDIFEYSQQDLVVTSVSAEDRDSGQFGMFTYAIVSGNTNGAFRINPATGDIIVDRTLDGRETNSYVLEVSATDRGGLSSLVNAIVTISIIGPDDPRPVFISPRYSFTIPENSNESSSIGSVEARNSDEGNLSPVRYLIHSGDPNGFFRMNPNTGELTVHSPPDREVQRYVLLNVQAASGSPPSYASVQVNISIEDVNDNAPSFAGSSPFTHISENEPRDSVVFIASATDPDEGVNGEVRYQLVDNPGSTFYITPSTGKVKLIREVNYEEQDKYILVIRAFDLGTPSQDSNLTFIVYITDVNNHGPQFNPPSYREMIPETARIGQNLLQVLATDRDTGSNAEIVFTLSPNAASSKFGVYPDTGWIYFHHRLDYELETEYLLEVVATDNGDEPKSATAAVHIIVTDVNDNSPHFDRGIYTFTTDENVFVGKTIGVVVARDRDSGQYGRVTYTMSTDGPFTIAELTGVITTTRAIDYEEQASYKLQVTATDGGNPPNSASVVVMIHVMDLNDNSPVFSHPSKYVTSVKEDEPTDTAVLVVVARDADSGSYGTVTYSLEPDLMEFKIDAVTGNITTSRVLDRETQDRYSLMVRASDGGTPPRTSLISVDVKVRDVNDNAPLVVGDNYTFTVNESDHQGSIIGQVIAFDSDAGGNGMLYYSIVDGNTLGMFAINRTTGVIVNTKEVDFEIAPHHQLQILVEDQGSIRPQSATVFVVINVLDANDNYPAFLEDPVYIDIMENSPENQPVWTFHATDADSGVNGDIRYRLVPEQTQFAIDPVTGILSTTSQTIDREMVSEFHFAVEAEDQAVGVTRRKTSVSVICFVADENDNYPILKSRSVTHVMEDEPVGYPVLHITAEDPDSRNNGDIIYQIVGGNSDGKFALGPDTGLLTIAHILDHEHKQKYELNISAHDQGVVQLLSWQVIEVYVEDVNDHPPVFQEMNYVFNVTEEQNQGLMVGQVVAFDRDSGTNGMLTYELPEGIADNYFEIDSETGVVRTRVQLDREERDNFHLTVYVMDGAFPSFYDVATITVYVMDINDNPPMFASDQFNLTLPEAQNIGVFHVVAAFDPDIQGSEIIHYQITDGNFGNNFDLDPTTGELTAQNPLDREETPDFTLTVMAIDGSNPQLTSTTQIHINVMDINDNDPVFSEPFYEVTIAENTPIGSSVITVEATDRDVGPNGAILYSLDNTMRRLFAIDEITGEITSVGRFDFEKEDQHIFQVRATDQGAVEQIGSRSEQVQVRVTLEDFNDNAPVFKNKPIRANISIGTGANTMVAALSADDKDSGSNGNVNYRFQNPSSQFAIQGNIVMTKTVLTLENFYQLTVIAYDGGTPSLTTEASLEIWVTDSNSWTLSFTSPEYLASVEEDADADTEVVTVHLSNPSSRTTVEFFLASGNEMGAFKLSTGTDSGTATILIQNSSTLDYEADPEIVLILEARDSAERHIPLYGYTKVTVSLQDANDNDPQFTQDRYSSSVLEGNGDSIFVTQVEATDADEGSNAAISYHIIEGNTNNAFAIDEETGIITTNGDLDREEKDLYRLTLRARDNGIPGRDDTVMIKITINDKNDNRPIFPIHDPIVISEGLEIGSVVTTVTAEDPDINPTITYSFAPGGNPGRMFNIDTYSGTITLAEPLDRERQEVYSLLVTASDSIHSDQSYIEVHILDENDNAPVFTEQSYQVLLPELTPPRHLVMKVNATDMDSGNNSRIRFSIDVPAIQEFSIDPETGSIYTEEIIQYNAAQPTIQLVVTAMDQGTPSLSQVVAVRIKVLDVNNNEPNFSSALYTGSVKENAPENTLVVTVIASDEDIHFANQKIDYSIVSGNEEDRFFISADSGDIRVYNPLDRETTDVYTLIVRAADRGSPQRNSTTEVVIEVLDVNDNPPVFSPSEYFGEINESAEVGEIVLTVNTFDLDKEENAQVIYDIVSGDDKGYFAIDGVGTITVRGELDHEEMPEARLVVMASDWGMNSSSSNVIVHINITDANDNHPYFPVMMYLERLPENTPPGVVFTAEALDKDTGIYGQLEYSIVESTGDGDFTIDPKTGEVSSTKEFDFEDVSSYILKIRAMDRGQKSVQVQAQVSITGVDEYEPVFTQTSYQFTIRPDAKPGDFIGQVNASDKDMGPDGEVLFHFQKDQEYFSINEYTGNITLKKELKSSSSSNERNKRSTDQYSFIIIGSSGQPGSLNSQVFVWVSAMPIEVGAVTMSSLLIIVVCCALFILILVVLCFLFAIMRIKKRENDQVDGTNLNRSASPRFYDNTFDRHVEMRHGIMNPNITENHMLKGHNSPRGMYVNPPQNSSMEVGHLTKTDVSDQSHSASSGRGSATVEDEEIRQINARTVPHQPRDVLDSGIQPDHEDGSLRNSASDINSPRAKTFNASVESMHVFVDEGGGEAGGQIGHLIYAQLDEAITDEDIAVVDGVNVFGYDNEVQPSMGGSLSSIVNSEEEYSGSYNWDYLLDWGPQFQPLAHVFAEIAKLKDDTFIPKSESRPFQQKAFQPLNKTYPPPLITNVVHGPIKQLHHSVEHNNSMNQAHLMHGHSPRSPIMYDASLIPAAVTPDLSPSLSPLAPGSPSLSPLVTSTGVSSTQSSRRNSGGSRTFVPPRTSGNGVTVKMPAHLTQEAEIHI